MPSTPNERLCDEDFYAVHQALGNNPAKMVTLGALSLEPHRAFRPFELKAAVHGLQGSQPAWEIGETTLSEYARLDFAPQGLAGVLPVPARAGKTVTAYQISPFGTKWGMAYIGACAEVCLDYPEVPWARVFGASHSHGNVGGTEVRHRLWSELVMHKSGLSYRQLSQRVADDLISERTVEKAARGLVKNKLLNATSVFSEDFDPRTRIISPSSAEHARSFNRLMPLTRLHYQAIAQLAASGSREPTLSEITTAAARLQPGLDQAALRAMLLGRLRGADCPKLGIELLDKGSLNSTERSLITIDPALQTPLKTMLQAMENSRYSYRGPQFRERARALLTTPFAVGRLMQAAKVHSRYA